MKKKKRGGENRITNRGIEMNTKFRGIETTRATDTEKRGGSRFHYQMGAGIIFTRPRYRNPLKLHRAIP